ncbi:Oxidoreductase [Burkholderia sp. 8Y]|uniref:Gfo/Idh/MocA family protein n=1 Tax=Burkholderia sp. 8Y TaxID=2653133 RepID=UPI0012F1986C|nr:Gfo/Idh/MocA family oxidoreductase [Burkholderia sp. 8Y]VXB37556.1 Oxidoreductase [Burkholderia sp. 8Y]
MSDSPSTGQDKPETRPPFVGASERRSPVEPPPLAPDRKVGFAIVGLGRLSLDSILPALASTKLARLAAVMTSDKAKGERVALQYGAPVDAVYGYDEWPRLAANDDVQAVYIVTPNGLHREQVIAAAGIGKHVLCEKPLSNTSAEAEEMIRACADAGVMLMVAYRLQYEPHNREAARLVRSKTFGELKIIEAHNGQVQGEANQWRHDKRLAGGGSLPDIGLYCLNFARFVTGEEPVEVSAWVWSTPGDARFAQVEENVSWQMRFPSGVVARCSAAYDAHESRIARLHCQRGTVVLDPAFAYKGLRLSVQHRSPEREDVEVREERILEDANQFAAEIDHMAECILTGRTPATPGEEGLQDQRIMEAIYRSAAENRPVELPAVAGRDAFRDARLSV